jgi:hypothetical protein
MTVNQISAGVQNRLLGGGLDHDVNTCLKQSLKIPAVPGMTEP